MKSIKVLFVCLGNICRSPMAEAIFRKKVKDEELDHLIEIDSAGTGDWHIGKPPHEGTRRILDERNISYSGMKARQFSEPDFEDYTYIVCMDSSNLKNVKEWSKQGESASRKQLFTFMELSPDRNLVDVPDPYYTGNFEYVYELIDEGCTKLLHSIKEKLDAGN